MARMVATVLGCGSSGGVPRVAFGWGRCDPNEPRNRRRRCSLLLERHEAGGTTRVLIDTSPDLREQLIEANVTHLDAVVMTHEHADHTHGIDDIRPLVIAMRRRMPIHADHTTLTMLTTRFGYCFQTPPGSDYPPIATQHLLEKYKPFTIEGQGGAIPFLPLPVEHGKLEALGFRVGDFCYLPDVSAIPDATASRLTGLDCWVLDALRDSPHPTHFSLADALEWIARMRPARAVLTNLHTDLDYARLVADLPTAIAPAYDGMRLEWETV